MKIYDEVASILSELSGVTSIRPEDSLQADLGLDSLQMVTLLLMLEERFSIVLQESDMNPFDLLSVAQVVNLVEKYRGEKRDAKEN